VSGDVELLRRTLDNVLRDAVSVSTTGQTIEMAMRTDDEARRYVI